MHWSASGRPPEVCEPCWGHAPGHHPDTSVLGNPSGLSGQRPSWDWRLCTQPSCPGSARSRFLQLAWGLQCVTGRAVSACDLYMPIPWEMEAPGLGVEAQLFPTPRYFSLVPSLVAMPLCLAASSSLRPHRPSPAAWRRYLQYYRVCARLLHPRPPWSLLTIGFLFKKLGRQLR